MKPKSVETDATWSLSDNKVKDEDPSAAAKRTSLISPIAEEGIDITTLQSSPRGVYTSSANTAPSPISRHGGLSGSSVLPLPLFSANQRYSSSTSIDGVSPSQQSMGTPVPILDFHARNRNSNGDAESLSERAISSRKMSPSGMIYDTSPRGVSPRSQNLSQVLQERVVSTGSPAGTLSYPRTNPHLAPELTLSSPRATLEVSSPRDSPTSLYSPRGKAAVTATGWTKRTDLFEA